MTDGLTTSKTVPAGKKIELTKEQKAKLKEQDKQILISYQFQIDTLIVEIERLEKMLKLNLAEREIKSNLKAYKEQLERFTNLKKVIEERNK